MVRPLVSYDDITTPQESGNRPTTMHGPDVPVSTASSNPHPPKRRRVNGKSRGGGAQVQHWDDPSGQAQQMNYDDSVVVESTSARVYVERKGEAQGEDMAEEEEEEEEEESRELTHEEIWDDSVLIDAWNSAMAEYEVRFISLFW